MKNPRHLHHQNQQDEVYLCTTLLRTIYCGKHSSYDPSRIESNSKHKASRYCKQSPGVSTCRHEAKESLSYCDQHLTQIIVDGVKKKIWRRQEGSLIFSRWEDWRKYICIMDPMLVLEGRCLSSGVTTISFQRKNTIFTYSKQ